MGGYPYEPSRGCIPWVPWGHGQGCHHILGLHERQGLLGDGLNERVEGGPEAHGPHGWGGRYSRERAHGLRGGK